MLRLALLPLFSLSSFAAAQLSQPSEGQVYNSFSGSGSFPVQYNDARGPLDLSVRDGSGFDYILANGIQAASGDTLNAVFAPLGICGDAILTAREQARNASASTANFTITCSPIQLAIPKQFGKRQSGPSGTLSRPSGGQVFQQGDSLSVTYNPVSEGGDTFAIDGVLVGETQNYTLFNGLWKQDSSSAITGLFSIPESACGDLQFVVTEHQIYQSSAIAFRAAAPAINVVCSSSNSTNATSPTNTSALPTNITSTATVLPTATSTAANGTTTLFNSTSSAPPSTSSAATSNSTILPAVSTTSGTSSSSVESSSTTSVPSTSSTLVTSTVTSTSAASTGPVVVTSIVTTTLPASTPSSSSSSTSSSSSIPSSSTSSSSSTSIPQGVSTVTVTSSGQSSSSTSRSTISSRPALVSTVTVTAQPTSEAGPTTIRVSEESQNGATPVTSLTNTFTVTQVVVVAAPSQSRITSTRLQTVIYISPSIAAVVQPSSAPTSALQPTGGASAKAVLSPLALAVASALLGGMLIW